MPLPDALSETATAALPGGATSVPLELRVTEPAVRSLRARARSTVGRVVRKALRPALAPLQGELHSATQRIAVLEAHVRALDEMLPLLVQIGDVAHRLQSMSVNQELLKNEVRTLAQRLEQLGTAIVPGAGLDGAGVRFAEVRERVYGLERRLRAIVSDAAVPTPSAAQPARPRSDDAASDRFDYAGFEQRFRGDPAIVLRTLETRYFDELAASPPVLDVGCGRGELVDLLARRGIEAYGIDTDPSLVAEGRAAGLDIRLGDVVAHLEALAPDSLGAIISTHVVEHLELDVLLHFIELAVSRLKPGGVFISETPNPASLIVLGNSYVLDPTHVRPLHPSLLSFLCEAAGFREIDFRFYEPATGYWLEPVDAPESPALGEQVNRAIERLNHVLFGPQEYAVIARTPPAPAHDAIG